LKKNRQPGVNSRAEFQGDGMEFDAELDDEELGNVDIEETRRIVYDLLKAVGEDPEREGLKNTPDRVARMYIELFSGYSAEPERIINGALFNINYDEMVVVRDIEFYSLCEHHMLPFIGRAHIAYIPKGKVIGLSKIPRIVDIYARRMQLQERMTRQIADFIMQKLEPHGVAVVVEAMHLCAMMRGVKKHDARMTTSAMHGSFRSNPATRQEFLDNISRGSKPLQF
jgi:GTP cyclohydrolase I